MSKKTFISCAKCEYFNLCPAGMHRMNGVSSDVPAYYEIGCFGHEQYENYLKGRQLKLW